MRDAANEVELSIDRPKKAADEEEGGTSTDSPSEI